MTCVCGIKVVFESRLSIGWGTTQRYHRTRIARAGSCYTFLHGTKVMMSHHFLETRFSSNNPVTVSKSPLTLGFEHSTQVTNLLTVLAFCAVAFICGSTSLIRLLIGRRLGTSGTRSGWTWPYTSYFTNKNHRSIIK